MYFIDKLALRAGNEKGEDEADTVGCCSLRIEHVGLIQDPPNTLRFDFLGKDSIRYVNEIVVDEQVFKNVKLFKKEPKVDGDLLFDRLDVSRHRLFHPSLALLRPPTDALFCPSSLRRGLSTSTSDRT